MDFKKIRFPDRIELKNLAPGTVYVEFDKTRIGDNGYGALLIHHPTRIRGFLCRVLKWLDTRIRKVGTIDYAKGDLRFSNRWYERVKTLDIYYMSASDFFEDTSSNEI